MKLIKLFLILGLIGSINAEETVDVNFRNLTLKSFIEMVAKVEKKNILIDANLKGKIDFISAKPIQKSSFFQLANSILGDKGYTIIDQGDFLKVVKSKDAAGEGIAVSKSIKGKTMKTVLFPLKNSNAAVLRSKLKPLLHKNADIISFKESNILAITAIPKNLESISKVINAIEGVERKQSIRIKLKYASSKDIYNNVKNMSKEMFPKTINTEKVDIYQDESTNSIIIVGKKSNIKRMKQYIKELDIQGDEDEQKMYVIALKNSDATEVQKMLSKLVSKINNSKKSKSSNKAEVVADIERNALIVLATPKQLKTIKRTILKIDIPKVQVYVKARIVEINTDLANQIGMRYGFEGGAITDQGLFSAATNLGASSLMVSNTLLGFLSNSTTQFDNNGNAYTTNESAFEFQSGISEVFALGAKLDLLKQNGAAHILSEPSILCTNNKEATIEVGQTQSILTQAQQSTQGQGNIINSYSREDIGITLKVKPRLSSNNQVALEVEAEIEDILPGSSTSADRPTTTKRKVKTNAIINNAETIILGGLMKSAGGTSSTKIPFLGDIPLLGELFKYDGKAESKINVVVYLTPYIVRNSRDLIRLKKVLKELDSIQIKYNSYVRKGLKKKLKTKKNKPKSNLDILDEA